MRFGDLRILLRRNPDNPKGHPILLIQMTLAYTKRYMGPKAEKTFTFPEIMFDPSLLLSPHIFLLALLFRHRAFDSDLLNDKPHMISTMEISDSTDELELFLKDNMRDKFIFRRCIKASMGFVMVSSSVSQPSRALLV